MAPHPMARRDLSSIQILRGLAAGLVVIAHVAEHADGISGNPVLITGRFGVDIFFVISGFIIAHISGDGPFDLKSFAIRRVFRVVPLYWACTILVLALALIAPALFKTTAADIEQFFYSLAFLPHSVNGGTEWRPLFKLGWTLNYEMFFYLLTALLFWCGTAFLRATILSLVMGALVIAGLVFDLENTFVGFYANLNLMPFILGFWLARMAGRPFFEHMSKPILASLWLVAIVLTAILYQTDFYALREVGGHTIMTLAALAIVTAGVASERYMVFPGSAWARMIGDSSYSLYLLHMFIVGAAWAIVNRLDLGQAPALVLAMVIAVPTSLAAAYVSYRLFERPISNWANRRTRTPLPLRQSEVSAQR